MAPRDGDRLTAGTPVEVWCRSYGTWVDGFDLVDWDGDRARVSRRSDRVLLPEPIDGHDVRERRRVGWPPQN